MVELHAHLLKAGVYDVTLVVKDAYGHSDSTTKKGFITVLQGVKPPVASFSAMPTYGESITNSKVYGQE